MSYSAGLSLIQLPIEILHGICYYLDIPDILRLRRVSRYLHRVSHDRDIWSDAYRNAEFFHPPGPFLSQSAHDLENVLISSFRVDRNIRWGGRTAQEERSILKLRVKEVLCTGLHPCVSLVFGRFLLIAFSEEIHCHDLNLDVFNSNSGASIIYRSTGVTVRSFHCVSAIDIEGRPFACVVLNEATEWASPGKISIYSLNLGDESDMTLDLLHQFEYSVFNIDAVDLGPRVIVIQGYDSDAHRFLVALDVHARIQYLLPSYTHATWDATEITLSKAFPTSTHLLLAQSFYTRAAGWSTFFQAFALPLPDAHRRLTSTLTSISPSHRGIIPGINVRETVLLHDSILDPPTQDVFIAIRVHAFEPARPLPSKHGIVHLHTSRDHEVGTIAFELLGSLGQFSQTPFLHPSFDGTGRVFYALESGSYGIVSALEYDLHASSGDDDELEAKITEHPCVLRTSTPRTLLDYDPYFGRICLQSGVGSQHSMIEVFDLAL
ncbi:hypothetical protein OG21DRAFT_1506574 [Imleria badia]|nr:hypothetical protein OG21DRAFT_1506574 [Imleria badia]